MSAHDHAAGRGHEHAAHRNHEHPAQEHAAGDRAHDAHQMEATWSVALSATLHCLTGCAIGEVLGMVIGTAAGLHNVATVTISIALAFVFGYALTMRGVLRAGLPVREA